MAATPAVSIVIPAYNAGRHLGEALASVDAQTFTDHEIIIVNDGSPDTAILEQVLAPRRGMLAYLEQENRGPSSARNAGIRAARGSFIAFLDADDLWLPEYLAEQMRAFERDPLLDLHYTDAVLFGDSPLAGKTFMEAVPSRGPATLEALLTARCVVITSCVVARRAALFEAGLFDEGFRHSEDFDLWARVAYHGRHLGYLPRPLARHRLHGASLAADVVKLLEAQAEVYRKLSRTLELGPALQETLRQQLRHTTATADLERGKRHLIAGEYDLAGRAFARASEYFTTRKLATARAVLRVSPEALRGGYRAYLALSAMRRSLRRTFSPRAGAER